MIYLISEFKSKNSQNPDKSPIFILKQKYQATSNYVNLVHYLDANIMSTRPSHQQPHRHTEHGAATHDPSRPKRASPLRWVLLVFPHKDHADQKFQR